MRNCHTAFHKGLLPGLAHSGLSTMITKGREPWTLRNTVRDADRTKPASQCKPIEVRRAGGLGAHWDGTARVLGAHAGAAAVPQAGRPAVV